MIRGLKEFVKSIILNLRSIYIEKEYCIQKGYRHRSKVQHFDDMDNTDKWQKEVYILAKNIAIDNKYRTVLDVGCGSAHKMIKYLKGFEFTGAEVEPTLSKLKERYDEYQFVHVDEINKSSYDLIICADVIEHVENPNLFLKHLSTLDFKKLILSTPSRNLFGKTSIGPPINVCHYREWTISEFPEFVGKYFNLRNHLITNIEQRTQVIICEKKK